MRCTSFMPTIYCLELYGFDKPRVTKYRQEGSLFEGLETSKKVVIYLSLPINEKDETRG